MFGSRLTGKNFTEDISSSSSDKTRRDATDVLENILDFDLEDEEDSAFMQVFRCLDSIGGIDDLIIQYAEDLLKIHAQLDRKKKHFIAQHQRH